ncbi:hypothetical protein [uncultured Jannaschia sp.]|uniref:hypothetical protein n=1 Tax=uncultured Jannaschia sp. TaxID=293347 RepID=UPI00261CE689|nr:hypothetical protein [uncultured Jannaschia sp.]
MSAFDYALFETHRDLAVRVWHARLEGAPIEAIAAREGTAVAEVWRILSRWPPEDIAFELRFRTGLRSFWICQEGVVRSDVLADATGRVHPFLLILVPTDMDPRDIRLQLARLRDLIRANGRPGFAFTDVEGNQEVEISLRMATDHGIPCCEICDDGDPLFCTGPRLRAYLEMALADQHEIVRPIRAFAPAPS